MFNLECSSLVTIIETHRKHRTFCEDETGQSLPRDVGNGVESRLLIQRSCQKVRIFKVYGKAEEGA